MRKYDSMNSKYTYISSSVVSDIFFTVFAMFYERAPRNVRYSARSLIPSRFTNARLSLAKDAITSFK